MCVNISLYIYIAFNRRIDPFCFYLFARVIHNEKRS